MPEMTGPRRSQLLEMLLSQQAQPHPNQRSVGEALANLGAQFIRQKEIKKLREQEAQAEESSNTRIADVLLGGEGRQVLDLESVDGGKERLTIPTKRGAEGRAELATKKASLTPSERLGVAQIQQEEADAARPSLAEEIRIREESTKRINQAQNAAALERQRINIDAERSMQERKLEHELTVQEKDEIRRENEQIRGIQAEFGLARLDHENAIAEAQAKAKSVGIDLTEQQAKASGWYGSALAGERVLEQALLAENGYVPSVESVALYAKSIDPDTGSATRVELRRAIPERALNLLDAANMVIDPVVRMRTGAAVRTDEFITTFNSLIPIGEGSQTERDNKNYFRRTLIQQLGIMAGPAEEVTRNNVYGRDVPVNDFSDNNAAATAEIDAQIAELDRLLAGEE